MYWCNNINSMYISVCISWVPVTGTKMPDIPKGGRIYFSSFSPWLSTGSETETSCRGTGRREVAQLVAIRKQESKGREPERKEEARDQSHLARSHAREPPL